MKINRKLLTVATCTLCILLVSACSETSALPEGEKLFTGLKKINYTDYEPNEHATNTQVEMESVLASAPNGALLGSSYYRTPFPIKLWIWNAFSQHTDAFSKWMTKAFGTRPKLLSQVNPELRAHIAQVQLKNYGYFNGKVTYKEVSRENSKKGKIAYTVDMGPLWRIDTLYYKGFPKSSDSLLAEAQTTTLLKHNTPLSISTLDAERQRIATTFRNNGYYYFQSGYTSYLADTLAKPQYVQLKLQMADSLPDKVYRQWYVGNIHINFHRDFMDSLTRHVTFRHFTESFNGRKPPLRAGVILRGMKLWPGKPYSADAETQWLNIIQSTNLFSYNNLTFTPRDSVNSDTLDVTLDLLLDKPYDFYVEGNARVKTTGHMGPELITGITKRNAFHGGEKLDFNLHGSYEWNTAHHAEGNHNALNSYELGADAALVMPRILTPRSLFMKRIQIDSLNRVKPPKRMHKPRMYAITPTTTIKASFNVLNRASYFRRHVVSGELTYDWYTSKQKHYTFSPLVLSYEYMNSKTAAFDSVLRDNPYLQISMRDQLVPKMSFTYAYTSPATYRNPVTWSITASEAGNLTSLAYMPFNKRWDSKSKKLFKNPYAQFLKLETDFVKTWQIAEHQQVVAHLSGGVIWSYGNATQAPYYEQFYVGGANSVRAFNVRSIGPGSYKPANGNYSYVEQTGDLKFLMNLEYRPRLFGNLYGAMFLDAGNVWALRNEDNRDGSMFKLKDAYKQMAVGTGVGLRYDMGMFVIRLDWGVGLHVPYDTHKGGFYNVKSFADAQSIHLAVGYPF